MEKLRFYKVADHYIRYLQQIDHRVQDNEGRRPYVGIVLRAGAYHYFVPAESPKPNHANLKPGIHLMKLDGGRYGLLGFNNMIPVPPCALIAFDIGQEPDLRYRTLLNKQVQFLRKNRVQVFDHAQKTYAAVTGSSNPFFHRICCDFKALEAACDRYQPPEQGPDAGSANHT